MSRFGTFRGKCDAIAVSEHDNPKKVIVKKLVLVVPDRPEISLDLSGDLSQLKKETFVIKEGVSYRIRIEFIVQREIVHGLKYVQKTNKMGIPGECSLVRKMRLLLTILY